MGKEKKIVGQTRSVCPECLARIRADKVQYGDQVYLEKTCSEHGFFRTLIWNGLPTYESWGSERTPVSPIGCTVQVDKGCPYDCGLCPSHGQRTCCVLLEITSRCNLGCPICFASADQTGPPDPTLAEIGTWYDTLLASGGPFNIQLSGGEPSLRDDIPEIIRIGREKGFPFFQLNTNGLRLAHEPGYAGVLKDAGLDCVFLQFDSLRDEAYQVLRGRGLKEIKLAAIKHCAEVGLGVVLVPTLMAGVNDQDIGSILSFAVEHMPYIRGVHFQPISYFGRYPGEPESRITIPDLLRAIEQQTDGRMLASDYKPGTAEHPYCSFNGSYLLQPDGSLRASQKQSSCCCEETPEDDCCASEKARSYVAKRWGQAPMPDDVVARDAQPNSFDSLIARVEQYSLAVSGMAFQDAWNLDLERLRYCYIHVVSADKRIVPFCAYNLTSRSGLSLHRKTIDTGV